MITFPLVKFIAVCQYVDMVCVYCGGDTRVTNSRARKRSNSTWRRRRCSRCGSIFTSVETVDLSGSIVVKSLAGVEPFSREKLLLSIYDSLRHRATALGDAEGLTGTVIASLYDLVQNATLEKDVITATVAQALRRFDKVAYVHYTAFHPLKVRGEK